MISVGNLAKLLDVSMRDLQNTMILQGMEENASHDQILSYEYASLLVGEFGKTAVMNEEAAFDIYPAPAPADTSKFVARPPVVTIMGHVDHGKTTLLDSLRSTSVAKGEAGGITQHIGAFSVPVKASGGKQTITFLDTPGHAAFSAMRARGASVTDIIVLVVAADDGVMAQTKEVINLIKKDIDNVGVVVALNKIDREGADPDSVRLELMAEGIELESHGGDIPAVEVSGLSGKGLDDLVETIAAVSELMDLRADRQSLLQGAILESRVVKGVGGTLQPGAHLICGTTSCKVRMMTDHTGKSIKVAYPGEAVNVAGWSEIPSAGDDVLQSTSEKDIRRALENRIRRAQSSAMVNDAAAINAFRRAAKEQHEAALAAKAAAKEAGQPLPDPANDIRKEESSGPKQLRIVLKADVSGSVEAVIGALEAITHPAAHAKVIHSGVGDVTESDLELATTAGGIVIAFNVKCPRPIEQAAVKAGVAIHSSGIIYRLTDEVRKQVSKLIPPIIEHSVIGVANLLQLFEVEQRGKKDKLQVCGCRISNGVVKKGSLARVIRGKDVVFEGKIDTLRHHKDLVQELIRGQECGLTIEGFTEGKTGDIIQVITTVEKPVQI
ncbi:initiation factor 2 [Auriculariales sp. MPI-PUGE-AT-0066]|nr:initiation factor 2 [Auriculariales sp. MPI-PUGE-AT-0066]